MILSEQKIARQIHLLLEREKFPLFEYEIVEKFNSEEGLSFENRISKILNDEKDGFGKIGQRFFNLGDNYFTGFIPKFQYIQNSLKSTIGSQSNAFVPFLFFLGRANSFIDPLSKRSIYNVGYEGLHQFEYLTKEIIEELSAAFPRISDFFSQMEILLGQFTSGNSLSGLFIEILDVLKSLDLDLISNSEFSMIFDHIIQFSLESNKSGFALSDPLSSEILTWFLPKDAAIRIIDPYLGVGSFLTNLAKKSGSSGSTFTGVEINKEVFEIACLNFIVNGISIENLHHSDSENFHKDGEYDFVVSDLPWIGSPQIRSITSRSSSPVHYVENALRFCKRGGKILLFVSDNFLDSPFKEIREYRKYLVENGVVEGVIRIKTNSNRKNFNKYTETILVLRNQPSSYESWVKFFDFSNLEKPFLPSDIKNYLDSFSLADGLLYIERDILKRHEYDLNPSHYDITIFETEQLIKNGQAEYLERLVTVKMGGSRVFDLPFDEPVSVFNHRSFSDKFEDKFVALDNLNKSEFAEQKVPRLSVLSQEAILINRIGRKFSPMIFRPSPELPKIFVSGEIIVIIPNSELIDIEYLYNQLYTTMVESQLQRFSKKTIFFHIPLSKLKKVVIPIMSLSAQSEFVATQALSIKSLEKKNEKEEQEERSIEEQKEATQDEVVRTFVHQIRAKIQTIDNNIYMVDQIAKKHDLMDHRLLYDESEELDENPTLGVYLKLVLDQSYHLQKELEFIREVMKFNIHQDKIDKLRIKKFFLNWSEGQNKGVGKKIKISISGQDPEVEFSPTAFRAIADQVYKNTLDHAFSDKYVDVSIKIEILNQEKTVIIDFRNNGAPSEIDFEDFIQPFRKRNGSNGSGIGGNYISRIVKAHQGDFRQIEISEGFGFRIEIPKKRIL